jgi:hypothetical protein
MFQEVKDCNSVELLSSFYESLESLVRILLNDRKSCVSKSLDRWLIDFDARNSLWVQPKERSTRATSYVKMSLHIFTEIEPSTLA